MKCADIEEVNRMLPPFPESIMCRAAAWAHRKEPLRLTSTTLVNCEAGAEMEGTQPTMPAKQQRMSMVERSDFADSRAILTADSEVTSTGTACTGRSGKWDLRVSMAFADEEIVEGRSRRQMPEQPCSRRALAVARASVPAPPVSTALPSTAKRCDARSEDEVAERGGSGAVRD